MILCDISGVKLFVNVALKIHFIIVILQTTVEYFFLGAVAKGTLCLDMICYNFVFKSMVKFIFRTPLRFLVHSHCHSLHISVPVTQITSSGRSRDKIQGFS